MMNRRQPVFYLLAILTLLIAPLSKADVPTPPAPPSPPAGYCSTIYNELNTDLTAFNLLLSVPATWVPVSLGPTVIPGNLQVADANAGPAISGTNYIASVLPQLYEEQAMGVKAILLQIGFPALYAPFQGGDAKLQPYLDFYQQLATTIHQMGMKLIVENDILLASDIQSGWPNLTQYFGTLSWNEYVSARATMAATIAETMQPDYLVVAEEPDTEAAQAGQPNLLIPADAAQMVTAEITAVRTSSYPNVLLGAGFGAWSQTNNLNSVAEYTAAYAALPLDYIDSHIYPINNSITGPVINNILTVAAGAAAAGKGISMSEYWVWKMEDSEYGVLPADTIRGRNPFNFWAPLDIQMIQTMQALAKYTDFVFMASDGPDYLFTYQTFAGTAQNGGSANCTCASATDDGTTPVYCDAYDIIQTETQLAKVANGSAEYSVTGFDLYGDLVSPPDTTPPSTPPAPTGSAGYTGANFSWPLSTDNVGVAGYNVYRCSPATLGGACTPVQIGLTTVPSYADQTLTENTFYNYQVQAFDMANNNSQISPILAVQTARTSTTAPSNLVATAVSAEEINLTWTAPQDSVSTYLIFSGSSPQSLTQIATVPSSKTTYSNKTLSPGTMYYYGVEAVASKVDSPMSPLAWATTLALPDPPNSVTAAPAGTSEIVLSWQEDEAKNGLQVESYQVWQGTVSGQLTKLPGTITGTTYTNRGLTANTTYYYEIVAVDSGKDTSIPSNQVSAVTDPLPPPPTNLAANAHSATEIIFTWNWSPLMNGLPAARYLIFCNNKQVGSEPTANGQSFTYRAATANTMYSCYVEAVDTANNDSQPSNEVAVTTPPMPNAPTNLQATNDTDTKVVITWSETLPPNGLQIKSYSIFRAATAAGLIGSKAVATRTTASYTDLTVKSGQTYYYAVEATDSGGDVSPMSTPLMVGTP